LDGLQHSQINICSICQTKLTSENEYIEQHVEQLHKTGVCRSCFTTTVADHLSCRGTFPLCQCKVIYAGKEYPCNERLGVNSYDKKIYESNLAIVKAQSDHCEAIARFGRWKVGLEIDNKRDTELRVTLNNLPPDSTIRPCPECGELIKHRMGCWRMTCNNCRHSFWFPTGETWDAVSTRKRKHYVDNPDYEWWNHPAEIEWVAYWSSWGKN